MSDYTPDWYELECREMSNSVRQIEYDHKKWGATATTALPGDRRSNREPDMSHGTSTPTAHQAEVARLADAAYERFWQTNAEAIQAHDAGDWVRARHLTLTAQTWLQRHAAYGDGWCA